MSFTMTAIIGLAALLLLTYLCMEFGFRHEHKARSLIYQAHQKKFKSVNDRLQQFEQLVEQQDKLIAALWDSAYGYRPKDSDYLIHSWSKHPNDAYGTKPEWTVEVREDGPSDRLERNTRYPWSDRR